MDSEIVGSNPSRVIFILTNRLNNHVFHYSTEMLLDLYKNYSYTMDSNLRSEDSPNVTICQHSVDFVVKINMGKHTTMKLILILLLLLQASLPLFWFAWIPRFRDERKTWLLRRLEDQNDCFYVPRQNGNYELTKLFCRREVLT